MQYIIIIMKIIHWFNNVMVVKWSGALLILAPWSTKTRELAGIGQKFGKQDDKPYVFFNYERPDADSL